MAKADFYTGLTIFALGIYMIVEGVRLPGAGGFIETGGEPGRVPIMLGVILAVLAVVLIARSVAAGGHLSSRAGARRARPGGGWVRSGLTALGCSVYAVGLLGSEILGYSVQYREATMLFVFAFVTCAEWADAPELAERRWQWFSRRFPSRVPALERSLAFVPSPWRPYVWLISMAAVQALLVAWAVGYLFEQELYVKLP